MWNISTYQWLQNIRYYIEPYDDDPTELTYLPSLPVRNASKIMKVKSMENVKFNCDAYKDCLVPQIEEQQLTGSTETMFNSAFFAKLLIQELVTQRRLSATMKEEDVEQLDVSNTPNEALDRRWSIEEEDNVENSTTLNHTWTLEENDLYSLDTCLRIVDDSFESILDDALSSSSSTSSEFDGIQPQPNILDCDDEDVTFEDKGISQSAIYQNIFELRKEQLTATGSTTTTTANKRQCLNMNDSVYENIWEFASTRNRAAKRLEIKHGNFCRVSTIFDETCQDLVVPEVRPLRCDLDYIIPECVNHWMRNVRYEYCSEDDERDKTMANHQQAVSHVNMSSSSTVNKNSQHDLVPKSPTTKCMGDSSTNEKFLSRRPTQQDLVTKGIIQEQRIFGNSLRKLSENVSGDRARVPEFVTTVVRMLELERNVVSHGIYRASGNVATIQKIRVRLNEGKNLDVLLQEFSKDVDVLTGSLKLFFRELAEPLISTEMFTELCSLKDKDPTDPDRLLSEVDEIVRRQPDCHRDVLLALVKHLLYVVSFSEQNSMSIESMSIVWGPSLIFTDSEDGATLLQRMTNNNSIVNFLLSAYNESFKREQYITMRSYYSESTLSLCSTSEKGSTSRSSYKQQHSIDYSIEDIELLLRNIEKSECAKRINIYVNSKMKKSKKIIERIKARKTIDKYFSTNDGLSGIVGALKTLVQEFKVVPAELTDDYDGTPLPFKDIEAALDRLPISNRRILELVLNHLNLMLNLNPNKYSQDLLIEAWTKYLFVSQIPNENLYKYFEQLLGYYQRLECDKGKQSTRQKQMIRDMNLNESFRMRGRTSESETSLDDEVLTTRCSSTSLNGDVEIRKSVKLHEKGEEQKRNNRNS